MLEAAQNSNFNPEFKNLFEQTITNKLEQE